MRMLTCLIVASFCLIAVSNVARADDERESGRTSNTKGSSSGSSKSPSAGTTKPVKPGTTGGSTTPAPVTTALNAEGEGRRAYLRYNCSGCHGDRAGGAIAPRIVGADSGDVSEAVLEGEEGGMPSYRRIVTPTEIKNIAAYLRSIGTTNEPKFNDWWVAIPPK